MSGEDSSSTGCDVMTERKHGHVYGFERPSLLEDLKIILCEYPDDGQIFKEMIQNAEDASARKVKIISVSYAKDICFKNGEQMAEKMHTASNSPTSCSWRPPFCEMFSMPGICVYNDAQFTEDDWKGIRKLHDSIKVKDPLKVGRFGLGFKSVFHLTDHPIILSGNTILFMDPFRMENESIHETSLNDLDEKERAALHHALTSLLHLLPEKSLTDKYFEGTTFWFPLRQKSSKLSETVYDENRVHQLKQALGSEISTLLLFLKKIESIEVFSYAGDSAQPTLDFSVGLSKECVEAVRSDREKFLSAITTRNKLCPRQENVMASYITLQMSRTKDSPGFERQEHWLVVNFHQGLDDMSPDLQNLCQRKYLTHRPYVSVAANLNSQLESFQGQLFCFLPLPPENPSPTGLPVHIHGFFELSQNRRHLKWPTIEKEDNSVPTDDALWWNILLVSEVLPRAYIKFVTELVHGSCPCESMRPLISKTVTHLEQLMPNPDRVTTHWQPLLAPFYRRFSFSSDPLFFTHVKGGHWVCLQDAVLMTSPAGNLTKATEEAVIQAYEACQVNLVRLSSHLMEGLGKAGLRSLPSAQDQRAEDEQNNLNHFCIACPQHLSDVMKKNNVWCTSLSSEQKCLILDYLYSERDNSLLQDLALLPLADGTFSKFADDKVYLCRHQQDLDLLPNLQNRLCFVTYPEKLHEQLRGLAVSDFGNLKLISDGDIPTLLQENLKVQWPNLSEITLTDNHWILHVWKYLHDHADLKRYDHLPLLPCLQNDVLQLQPLNGNYICGKLEDYPPISSLLCSALRKLGVHVIPSLPEFVMHHRDVLHKRVQPPFPLGILKSLARLNKESPSNLDVAVNRFNEKASSGERLALLKVAAEGLNINCDGEDIEMAKGVLRRLKVFPLWPDCIAQQTSLKRDTGEDASKIMDHFTSNIDGCCITPNISPLPPHVKFVPRLIHCDSKSARDFALTLGSIEMSLKELVEKTLNKLLGRSPGISELSCLKSDVTLFMIYFLQSAAFENIELQRLAKHIQFVPTCSSQELKRADELFNPDDKLLQDLFAGRDAFPLKSFYQNEAFILPKLKQLGLREVSAVTDQELIGVAKKLDTGCNSSRDLEQCLSSVFTRANALWNFLLQYHCNFSENTIKQLAVFRCLPCVNTREMVAADYPEVVPVCPDKYEILGIARAVDMCEYSELHVVASIKPVSFSTKCPIPSLFSKPSAEDIVQHLEIVTKCFNGKHLPHFASTLHLIYEKLKLLHDEGINVKVLIKDLPCILIETVGNFRCCYEFWIQSENGNDLDLSPYRYPLPRAQITESFSELFVACGCSPKQDSNLLKVVLQEIYSKHKEDKHSAEDCSKDLKLVCRILKAISDKNEFEIGEVLLPVHSPERDSLCFIAAKECTVAMDPKDVEFLEDEGMTFVHPDLDKDIAIKLGALDLRSRSMVGLADLDVDMESEFGQNEPLTTRLCNLLKDGYTDGFSVPKELMQNADDAGATVVKFLIDERENREWRTGLLTSSLADLQGPALWVFNDAQFTNKDFENLCKLGGATKKEDCSKVGRFGLGFNAVYNVTEVPSVYSDCTFAMLDPHESYLDSKRGMKMNFNILTNKVLLKRIPNQFRPFQEIFGCKISYKEWKPYPGTLFRFPFRTEAQAEKSQICKEAFSRSKQQDFIRNMLSKAGNLMLFLQHVTKVELHRLPCDSQSPAEPELLTVLTRDSIDTTVSLPSNCSILDHVCKLWQNAPVPKKHTIIEKIILAKENYNMSNDQAKLQKCQFILAWATGMEKSHDVAQEVHEEGFVPLAAVAVPVDEEELVTDISGCPEGFYNTGHLFCFLPLAKEVFGSSLPVHINAPFAVTSDRRGLLIKTEDDSKLIGGRWNMALFSDPIPRAYLVALERVAEKHTTSDLYYKIWPECPTQLEIESTSPQSALFSNFYRLLVEEEFCVFIHRDGCKTFSDSFFFDPDFKETKTGQIAFKVLELFWDQTEWCSGTLLDLQFHIAKTIRSSEQKLAFTKKVITKNQFFQKFLFPRIAKGDKRLKPEDRDQLVLHALLSGDEQLQELVKSYACIPCRPDGRLQFPEHLIHPEGFAAPLFSDNDGRFPQQGQGADFSTGKALNQLLKLGMVKDKLSIQELEQRAESIEKIELNTALSRANAIVKYLSGCEKEVVDNCIGVLKNINFLPKLAKPKKWPMPWFDQEARFIAPCSAFSEHLKELVGSQASVLNEAELDLSNTNWHVLEMLGVTRFQSSVKDTSLTKITVSQMKNITTLNPEIWLDNNDKYKAVSDICKKIYKHLNNYCKDLKKYADHRQVMEELKGYPVVLTEQGFKQMELLAHGSRNDFEPYLLFVDGQRWHCHQFFRLLGVKERFGVSDILLAMKQLRSDHCSSQLNSRLVDTVFNLALLLEETLKQVEGRDCLEIEKAEDVHLPDKEGWLYPVKELCLNDCDWVEESETMHFLHPKFSEHLAHVFCIRTKREHDEDEFSESFGQHEQLTTRINRLLEGYRRDESIFKELLQNADDAGATEVWFVKDLRTHNTDKLLDESWKNVFGPALCIFNNARFTLRDMEGIQALGEGSKEGDALKTGKYGVGFNAVYNLTDIPSFWTHVVAGDENISKVDEKKLGEKLCVMDPNFFVTSRRRFRLPGQRLSINDRFKAQYPSMLNPFLLECDSIHAEMGTVFRLPLRTEDCASKSKIRQPAAAMDVVSNHLKGFQDSMGESLLFLNNVKKISVYTAQKDGTMQLEYETQLTADESNAQKHREFFQHVQREGKNLQIQNWASIPEPKEVAVQCCLQSNDGNKKEWLVVHRFGLSEKAHHSLLHPEAVRKHRLFPLGGVALCLSPETSSQKYLKTARISDSKDKTGDISRQKVFFAYCTLPLPVRTGLPVHVNGRFALDHETRRNIDTQPDNELYTWNILLAETIIVPTYIAVLHEVKRLCFSREEVSFNQNDTNLKRDENEQRIKQRKLAKDYDDMKTQHTEEINLMTMKDLDQKLKYYSNFFPEHKKNCDAFWNFLVTSFYKQLAQTEADVFPTVRKDLGHLLWVPAVKLAGFPGHFWENSLKLNSHLKEILMKLNMNIIECPFSIYEEFQKAEVVAVKKITEETVINFLQSCHRDISERDSCNLKNLPKAVYDTGFTTVENVQEVFKFIYRQIKDLKNLPLSLRMSGRLNYFTTQRPVIVSQFCDLLPGSSELFLHSSLLDFIQVENFPEYLKAFDTRLLIQQLSHTLDESTFGRGKIFRLDINSLNQNISLISCWIRRFWQFLETLFTPRLDGVNSQHLWSLENDLQLWSLLPVISENQVDLYPLKYRHRVVYVPEGNQGVSDINSILRKLQFKKLYMKMLPFPRVATQIVASVENPSLLLKAFASGNLHGHTLHRREAKCILDFFWRKVICNDHDHDRELRNLPFFEKLDGTFMAVGNKKTFCLPFNIPLVGLNELCDKKNVALLKNNHTLSELFLHVNINSQEVSGFYIRYLLPSISDLPADAILQHMEYLRDKVISKFDDYLIQQLKKTPFIKGFDGTFCKASDFYSPHCKVFQCMIPQEQFPSPPYNEVKWQKFLEYVGMVSEVSEDMFLRFAREIEKAGKHPISDTVKQQSLELIQHLKQSSTLQSECFLKQLRDIRFLVPLTLVQVESGHVLQSIYPLFRPQTPLVAFSKAFSLKHQFLVWTCGCLLSKDADLESHMFNSIPPNDLVLKHVQNICQAMNRKNGTSVLAKFDSDSFVIVENIMETIYKHLATFDRQELTVLRECAIIFDKKRKAVFSPDQIVIRIPLSQIIDNHVMDAPETLGTHFDLFRKLGVLDEVELNHYAKVLERIHVASPGNINPNDRELVAAAVDKFFNLLKSDSNQSTLGIPVLYLPAEEISQLIDENSQVSQIRLVNSRELVLEFNEHILKRIKQPIKGLDVFVDFVRLGHKHHNLHNENSLLPEAYRMKQWHEVVEEILEESCKTLAKEDADTLWLTNLLHLEEFAVMVKRLANWEKLQNGKKRTEDEDRAIDEQLRELTIHKVTKLMTVLKRDKSVLPGTEEHCEFFIEREKIDSKNGLQQISKVSLYIDSQIEITKDLNNKMLVNKVHKAVEWAVEVNLAPILDVCLGSLEEAQKLMDMDGIPSYNTRQFIKPVFPPPGTFVPDDMHFMLDNDVYTFKLFEYVAYELYDPCLQAEDEGHGNGETNKKTNMATDPEDTSEQADTTGLKQSDLNGKPIYVFARILQIIEPKDTDITDERTRLLLLRYSIDIGEKGNKEVEACQLYKFTNPSPCAVVPCTGEAALPSAAFSQFNANEDLETVLKDIRDQLCEIWKKLPDDKSRLRIVKRLLLKWHPDKNVYREEFCTKVFQQIRHYVQLLIKGRKLVPDDEDHVDSFSPSKRQSHYYHGRHRYQSKQFFEASFFNNIFSRGQTYAQSSRTYCGKSGRSQWYDFFHSQSSAGKTSPQRVEGRRWMRQAQKDLEVGKVTLCHGGDGSYNWACYQAHQTAEKALKAVLYCSSSEHGLKFSHDISCIADSIGDKQLKSWTTTLTSIVKYHTRMRYPDLCDFPQIPSDMYSKSEAEEVQRLAENIMNRSEELFNQYNTPPPSPPRQRKQCHSPKVDTPHHSSSHGLSGSSGCRRVMPSTSISHRAIEKSDEPTVKWHKIDPSIKALPPP